MRNPVIDSDFPDPEIIRVGETYYMVSTTMYFMPGADILRSWDLAHWELVGHVFDSLRTMPPTTWKAAGTFTARACGRRPCPGTRACSI